MNGAGGRRTISAVSGESGLVLATPLSSGPSCLKTGGFASPPRGGFALFSWRAARRWSTARRGESTRGHRPDKPVPKGRQKTVDRTRICTSPSRPLEYKHFVHEIFNGQAQDSTTRDGRRLRLRGGDSAVAAPNHSGGRSLQSAA